MQQAWFAANKEGLIDRLGLKDYPYNPPYLYFMKDGVEEVWENTKANKWLLDHLVKKCNEDKDFFPKIHKLYFERLTEIEQWWKKDITTIDELKTFIDKVFDGVSDFVVLYGALMDERIAEEYRDLANKFREKDVFFAECNTAIWKALNTIYPDLGSLVIYITKEELGKNLSKQELENRGQGFVLIPGIFVGRLSFEDLIHQFPEYTFQIEKGDRDKDGIKGQSAFGGSVIGSVRIVKRKEQIDQLVEGEIIVSPMTTPDMIPAMRKAAAFVTDEGGITCHAAIIAREMQKPCVIGTQIATQVLKDGDLVEVDANNGVVKILKNEIHGKQDEWVFMWSTTPIMPTYWTTSQALLDRCDVYSNGEIFCYFDGSIITTYMQKSQLEKFKREGEKYLEPEFFKKYQSQYQEEAKKWWSWARIVEKTDYSKIKISDLIKDHSHFVEYARDSIAYFGSTRTEFTYAAEQRLEVLIKKYFGDKWPDTFGTLTISPDLDDIQKEYLDWLKIFTEEIDNLKLLGHASKYPWLVFGQFDDSKVLDFLKNRAKEEKGNFDLETKRLKKSKEELKKNQNEIFETVGNDAKETKYLAEFLQTQSVERMNIKSYWAGSYYLTRKMWLKITERLNLPLWDMLGYIVPPETEQLLNGDYKGDIESVIDDRKIAHALVIENNILRIVGSKEATSLFGQRIKKAENIDNTIKGQTAMLGMARGKVRKVIAGDLDMLQNSIKDFKKGEILVTSMTQPNMMVIAERASAIVTDEGGITSHAAIIARELKIPCIVGCLHSMQLLNDGDEVEVDANNGLVRIIK